eukprot:EG_transcript_6434
MDGVFFFIFALFVSFLFLSSPFQAAASYQRTSVQIIANPSYSPSLLNKRFLRPYVPEVHGNVIATSRPVEGQAVMSAIGRRTSASNLRSSTNQRIIFQPALGPPMITNLYGSIVYRMVLVSSLMLMFVSARLGAVRCIRRSLHKGEKFAMCAVGGDDPAGKPLSWDASNDASQSANDRIPNQGTGETDIPDSDKYVDPANPYKPVFWSAPRSEEASSNSLLDSNKYVDPADPYKPVFWSAPKTSTSTSTSLPPILEAPQQITPVLASTGGTGAGSNTAAEAPLPYSPAEDDDEAEDAERRKAKPFLTVPDKEEMQSFLFPPKEEMPEEVYMSIWDHVEELRERVAIAAIGCLLLVLLCFVFAKDLVLLLQDPVAEKGVRFLQLTPGEYFFTTVKVAGYSGMLLGAPLVLYQVMAYVTPGLTQSERKFIGPIVLGSSVLFYVGLVFSYLILTPAALNFFVSYGADAVESLWSIDQYFEFVLVLMLSTGLAFQVPVVQVLLGTIGVLSSDQMLSGWRYVVVGATIAAAVLTPSTDPFTQLLLAVPLVGLYLGGAFAVKAIEASRRRDAEASEAA